MAYRVNEDKPDWSVVHRADSTNHHCQPRDKKEGDGGWHYCHTDQELIDLLGVVKRRSGSKIKACTYCEPNIPPAAQHYLT